MAIDYRDHEVVFTDIVGVEDAEVLLAWLQEHGSAQADFSGCAHMHPANATSTHGRASARGRLACRRSSGHGSAQRLFQRLARR